MYISAYSNYIVDSQSHKEKLCRFHTDEISPVILSELLEKPKVNNIAGDSQAKSSVSGFLTNISVP